MKDARSLTPEAQEALRTRAVKAVQNGKNQSQVARDFGVSRQRVNQWMKAYRKGGSKALKAKRQGRPPGTGKRLKGWQAGIVVRTITDNTPEQLKMSFLLWTRESVQQFIEERFGIQVSARTVGRWLKRWGFTPQKPTRRAYERNEREVQAWLKTEYPQIRKEAKQEGAEIHWGDEMGMRSDHQAGRSYSRRGQTPVIPGTGQRFSCQMISTITNRGSLRFMVFSGRFTSKVFIQFLKRLIKTVSRKVYVIVDGHPVHKSRNVTNWVNQHANQIRLIFLPAYSPDLNPDEYLNQDVKTNAVGRRRPKDQAELKADVRSYLHSTQKQKPIVKSYFHAPSVQYASN